MPEIDIQDLARASVYKLLIGSVVPRPIAWVSTVNQQGQPNLAPFSFFTLVCADPPTLVFCPMIRSSDGRPKDTLSNIRQTGEFVVNVPTEDLAQAVNISSTEFDPEVNEFVAAGVTPVASVKVRPPRVAESPINFECVVQHILDIGDQPLSGSLVVGRILHIHVDERVLTGQDHIDLFQLKPIARLAGADYARVTDIFSLKRPETKLTILK